ncbi:DUF1600 domain-containing protein [Mycoplasmoides pirum]|uniref:DUF1600 domain-containing protein n=1 Tax=Mycoplasmoides pirum TaxID=2122 RepID=UPI000696EFD3|nr:DUF1600 domain-containing protein [Mycoplasmoides pirum]
MIFKKKFCYDSSIFINYFKNFSKTRWIFFGAFYFFLIAFGLFIYQIITGLIQNTPADNPWIVIDKFTWQSNILLLIFSFFYVFLPKHQFLKTDSFLICVLTYIFFTFFGYNFILTFLNNGYSGNPLDIFISVWTHLICPVLFIICGILKFVFEPQKIRLRRFIRILSFGMIYPTIYLIYLSTIPFVFNNGNETYSIYGIATNTKDNPSIAWPIIFGMYFLFFPGTLFGFYSIAKIIAKKMKK